MKCPLCQAPSRPVGGGLGVHGHGVRSRQVWGVLSPEAAPAIHEILVRRYLCQSCGQTITVAPEGMARRYLYLVTTIAVGLWRWGRQRKPARQVRQQLCPWRVRGPARPQRWNSLPRWTAQRERLWPRAEPSLRRAVDADASVRQQAAQVSTVLAAFDSGLVFAEAPEETAAWQGALWGLAM